MCGVIVVDAESFRSTWHGRDAYIHDHCLDSLITMHFSINCSAVICSPTVLFTILREASSESYGPRVYLLSYKFPIYFYLHLYFLHLYYKIPKIYLSYHIISIRSHFRKWPWRDWQPLYRVGCEFFVCLCRFVGLVRSLLLDWYLGSQKLREILTLLCCITLSSSRKTNASSRRSNPHGPQLDGHAQPNRGPFRWKGQLVWFG